MMQDTKLHAQESAKSLSVMWQNRVTQIHGDESFSLSHFASAQYVILVFFCIMSATHSLSAVTVATSP